jgi:hypothetical protein
MIKTTNYEISKKLAEIGFRAECSYFYFHGDNNDCETSSLEKYGFDKIDDCDIEDKYYPAYDLETLLSALPDTIGGCLMIHKEGMYYQESMIEVQKQKNESLADTAGRMIIELYENNLIKF